MDVITVRIFSRLAIKVSCGSFVEGFSRSQGVDL